MQFIRDIYGDKMAANQPVISFEFFPPKTDEQRATLEASLTKLKPLQPDYVSVTFGAGGSTLSYTPEIVQRLRQVHKLDAAPHLSCVGGTRKEIHALLQQYKTMGCRRIVALRGDLPSGMATSGSTSGIFFVVGGADSSDSPASGREEIEIALAP